VLPDRIWDSWKWRYELKNPPDPEVELARAHAAIRAVLVRSKEKAVEAITRKHQLHIRLEDEMNYIAVLSEQIEQASGRGESELVQELNQQKEFSEVKIVAIQFPTSKRARRSSR